MWADAVNRFGQIIIARGMLRLRPYSRAKPEIQTELWCPSAFFYVHWFLDVIPPEILDGSRITIFGNLVTANLGRHLSIRNALTIPGQGAKVKRALANLLASAALKPQAYISEEELDASLARLQMPRAR